MKRVLTILTFVFAGFIAFAQHTVTGTLIDKITGETLIGASVVVGGTDIGTSTDIDGKFTLTNVPGGAQQIKFTYLGYEDMLHEVTVNSDTALETLKLGASEVGLKEVEILGSLAIDRRTPVAVTNIPGAEIALKVGNQEYVEILRKTPSVYVTKQGGGFGDSRINVRGFDQRNTAVMINGIPVNDMENGWVYWSNWAGLSDVTSKIQIQRGLGATKLAAPTVGGSINIITNAAQIKRKGSYSLGIGNDGYFKTGLSYSTGLFGNGLAASVQVTRRQGNGYVDGTKFSSWSYFAALSKVFNRAHTISISAVGAPQWHHQRGRPSRFDEIYLQTYLDKGFKYNHRLGNLDGEEFNWNRNFYHKPKVFLNHYWNINNRTDLKTSAYISFGRGGGTGARGNVIVDDAEIYDSFAADGEDLYDEDGQVRFNDIVAYNMGESISINNFNTQNEEPDTISNFGSGLIRRASMNYHNWYGALTTLTHKLTDEFTLTAGLDGRYYKGEHFRRLEDLLGGKAYRSTSNINNPNNIITTPVSATFGNFFDTSYKSGNVLNYHNDGLVGWGGAFAQVEYVANNLSAFVSLSGSNQSFRRIDYFTYYNDESRDSISNRIAMEDGQESADLWLEDNLPQKSDWVSLLGGTVKAGVNYNFGKSNVFINGGYLSRQPNFQGVFEGFSNVVIEDIENQIVTAIEGGYGFRSKLFDLKLNLYATQWINQTFTRSEGYYILAERDTSIFIYELGQDVDIAVGDTLIDANGELAFNRDGTAIFRGVDQRHAGIELETNIRPNKFIDVDFTLSLGNWIYTDDFLGNIYEHYMLTGSLLVMPHKLPFL